MESGPTRTAWTSQQAAASAAAGAPPPTELLSAATALFAGSLPLAMQYAETLTTVGVQRGIIGPAEAERIWDRHILNCAAVARLVPGKSALVDLGSGAGLPGIVLAMLLPTVRVTLLEPMARRVEFLEECVAELGLGNASVLRGRAEDLAGQLSADVVTARAVAPLDKLAGLALGLARPGGKVLAIKGSAAEAELARARPVLARLGVTDARVVVTGSEDRGAAATVVAFSAPGHRVGGSSSSTMRPRRGGQQFSAPGSVGRSADGRRGRNARPNSRRAG